MVGEYALRNPLALITAAALTIGGFLLMGFFLRIGFMPDVDLAGSMALLFAAAIVGIGTLIALVLATVMPGVSMRYLLDQAQVPVNWPSMLVTAGPAVLLVALVVLLPLALEASQVPSIWLVGSVCYAIAFVASGILIAKRHDMPGSRLDKIQRIGLLWMCSFLWTLGLFQVLQTALRMGVDSTHPHVLIFFVLACWLFMIGAINVVMAQFPLRVSLVAGPVAGLLSVGVLAMLTGSYSTVSFMTVRTLGIGEIHGTNLMLTADMCQALNATPGTLHCEPLTDKATVGVLKNVTIVSRIGSNVVAEGPASKSDPTQTRLRVVLRKDAVVAWTMPGGKAP
jgi:MFS family permease